MDQNYSSECALVLDVKTARKYPGAKRTPSEMKPVRHWKTHPDCFEEVWPALREQLQAHPGLEAKTLFAALQRQYPECFADGQLRTLQQRVKQWRALEGPAQEVFFAQQHRAGELCQSDFTHLSELGITLCGEPYPHLLYHFVLTYSNWEIDTLCQSESFASLSEGLQNALWELGGVPARHRTDRMTAAEAVSGAAAALRTARGKDSDWASAGKRRHRTTPLPVQVSLRPSAPVTGSSGLRQCSGVSGLPDEAVCPTQWGRRSRLQEELAVLGPLPARRFESVRHFRARVNTGSLVRVDRNHYSVQSRLMGEMVEARVFAHHLQIWYGGTQVEEMPRLPGRSRYRIDYRRIIDWLVRKPGAFAQYRYRDHLFPSSQFRRAYDLLQTATPRRADRRYLEILQLPAQQGEARIEDALRLLLASASGQQAMVNRAAFEEFLERCEPAPDLTDVQIAEVSLASFDQLFTETGVRL
jgi:hypothetical protein